MGHYHARVYACIHEEKRTAEWVLIYQLLRQNPLVRLVYAFDGSRNRALCKGIEAVSIVADDADKGRNKFEF
jgi:hypothetical protein